jgi:hypothetical protein
MEWIPCVRAQHTNGWNCASAQWEQGKLTVHITPLLWHNSMWEITWKMFQDQYNIWEKNWKVEMMFVVKKSIILSYFQNVEYQYISVCVCVCACQFCVFPSSLWSCKV